MRGSLWKAGFAGVGACLAIACSLSGCVAMPVDTPGVPSPSRTGTAAVLGIPSVSDDEVARVVAEGEPLQVDSTSQRATQPGVDYAVEAACLSVNEATVVAYQLITDGDVVSTGTIACDGNTYRNTGPTGTGGQVRLMFDDLPQDVTRAFARLVAGER